MMKYIAVMVVVFFGGQGVAMAFSEALMDAAPNSCLVDVDADDYGLIWDGNCHSGKAAGLGTLTFHGNEDKVVTVTANFVDGSPSGIAVVSYKTTDGEHNVCAMKWGDDIQENVCWGAQHGAYRGNWFK